MIEAGGAMWRCFATTAFPGVQADVMMVATSGDKRSLRTVALRELKAEHATVKRQSPLQIGHFQMNVADADSGMDGRAHLKRR